MKQTIYVVTNGEYSDYKIQGVFSSEALAQTFIDRFSKHDRNRDGCSIEEWLLDGRKTDKQRIVYGVQLKADTGDVLRTWTYDTFTSARFTASYGSGTTGLIHGASAVSAEHALKIAAEARQKYLREKAVA